jgi:cytochrome c oxidase cbb3-type subunit 4
VNYHILREVADSFGLLFLFAVFLTAVWWAMRPSAKVHHQSARMIPLSDEEPRHGQA